MIKRSRKFLQILSFDIFSESKLKLYIESRIFPEPFENKMHVVWELSSFRYFSNFSDIIEMLLWVFMKLCVDLSIFHKNFNTCGLQKFWQYVELHLYDHLYHRYFMILNGIIIRYLLRSSYKNWYCL